MEGSRQSSVVNAGVGSLCLSAMLSLTLVLGAPAQTAVIRCRPATGAAGRVVEAPFVMELGEGEMSNKFQLVIHVSADGDGPVLSDRLGYRNLLDPAAGKGGPTATARIEEPDTSALSAGWWGSGSMFEMVVGPATVTLGRCLITIPDSAEAGDSYTVHLVPYDEVTKLGTIAKVATMGPIATELGPDVTVSVGGGASYGLDEPVTPTDAVP